MPFSLGRVHHGFGGITATIFKDQKESQANSQQKAG
jgi:hypothetical protein